MYCRENHSAWQPTHLFSHLDQRVLSSLTYGPMKPSTQQIKNTISLLRKKLRDIRSMEQDSEGFQEALSILSDRRTTYRSISGLRTRQGRAIALLAIDYMNGACESRTLLRFK
ncbi:hypothetical protein BWI93_23525 [Siphonobacter sp. BAB-5385]|nr:hypothetical protein BWI93_23525 [Siphonobacter sp. BAB-5385]